MTTSNYRGREKKTRIGNYPRRMSIYLTEEDYQLLEKLAKEKYQTAVSATLRSLLHKTISAEIKT